MRGFAVIAAGLDGLGYWMLRPNRARVHPALELETWDAVADGQHNSNTDLIVWKGSLLLCHAASPYHMGSAQCRLVMRRSPDPRVWEKVAELGRGGRRHSRPKVRRDRRSPLPLRPAESGLRRCALWHGVRHQHERIAA